MSKLTFNPRTTILILFISAVGLIRVAINFSPTISPLMNFSPLGAMALFGGACFTRKWKAFSFPLLSLFISDLILHQTVFRQYSDGILYNGWYWVYGAFALMTLAGRIILSKITVTRFLVSVFACVMIHWMVTDFGIWQHSVIYTHDLNGWLDCLVAAIPYEWRFLAGTLVYGSILFGSFEWLQRRYFIKHVPV